ncbi:hypothetical protein GCM10012278_60740 [Nonomuraea glycinis]|uniref:Uncharacterized protein n=2 Tax=Nonomuraea glycinis TaxID=2047744 RepID=A0A918E7D4_9ACTN|nr:hypothetical protein GCM10012278_60740 [Nonomuraea glycinis]
MARARREVGDRPPATGAKQRGVLMTEVATAESMSGPTARRYICGLSCLADGADQIFARGVLNVGGVLEAVIPAKEYRDGLPSECHAAYDELLGRAVRTHRLEFVESTSESHMMASARMLDDADVLFAVWDGQPARGYGGTADVVVEARRREVPVRVIWPEGARRD